MYIYIYIYISKYIYYYIILFYIYQLLASHWVIMGNYRLSKFIYKFDDKRSKISLYFDFYKSSAEWQ